MLLLRRCLDVAAQDLLRGGKHAGDLDDIHFALATACIWAGFQSIASLQGVYGRAALEGGIQAAGGAWKQHGFTLLHVLAGMAMIQPALALVHGFVSLFKWPRQRPPQPPHGGGWCKAAARGCLAWFGLSKREPDKKLA